MTNPLQTIPNLPVAVGTTGTDQLWINQSGTDRRTTLSTLQSSVPGPQGNQGNPGGNASAIGVATAVSGLSLNTGTPSTYNLFHTDGYYTAGDGGGAFYYRNTGSAQPGDLMSADGVRLSLSLAQQLTWEMLGAPTTGAIFTGVLTAGVLTTSGLQSGAIAIGMTLTAVGGTGTVTAGTVIMGGSGTTWQTNKTQTLGSTVMVANDSWSYVANALALGPHSLLSVGPHWFSQCIAAQTSGGPINWFGPQGYLGGSAGYPATWLFPSGYGGIAFSPTNNTITPQGDITFTGSEPFGGIHTSSIDKIAVQIGNGSRPAVSVNHRPAIGFYAIIKATNLAVTGADGNGYKVFGVIPTNIADKGVLRDSYVQNSYDNGGEVSGTDGNTWDIQNIITNQNGASGWWEHSFLQTDYRTIQSQGNGRINAIVRRSNNDYYSIQDANTGNDPLTSPLWWTLWKADVGADTYDPAVTYRVGSAFRTSGNNNRVTLVGLYTESGQPPALLQNANASGPLSVVLGGLSAAGIAGTYMGMIDGVASATQFSGASSGNPVFAAHVDDFPIGIGVELTASASGSPAAAGLIFAYAPDTATAGTEQALIRGGRAGTSSGYFEISANNSSGVRTDMLRFDGQLAEYQPATDNAFALGDATHRLTNLFSVNFRPGAGAVIWTSGIGSPNTVVAAPVGSLYTDTAGGSGTTFYVKETGAATSSGWVAK